ncbi:MAG: NAD(P)(+) transhydrogenase (Re/Si-specific) subunit beta [Synechococcales cyanobacterium RM1_1_8]|nr:NAD(P)(+) transhydrogenase (Re/Si-specific) subunit beta [Synechococcales cyanobacterium RM1_1_8]
MDTFLPSTIQLSYLAATALFFVGLKKLGSPATARNGNQLAAVGMLLAVVATLLDRQVVNYPMIGGAIALGSIVGIIGAKKVAMTEMPQMVGLLNGLGGAASALVAIAEFYRLLLEGNVPFDATLTAILGSLIGGITFSGSFIAFAKLQGLITGKPLSLPGQKIINILLFAGFLIGSVLLLIDPLHTSTFLVITGISLLLGLFLVLPIGGGDMPVVISLLNSLSGLAASAAGFVVMNNILIVAGALVGASGLILTVIMCKAMNRTLTNVLFSAFGGATAGSGGGGADDGDKSYRQVDAEAGAMMLGYARSVVVVPGYGMAVAQAQHSVRELADQLEKKGVEVKYAIHPVAGRMPGHMNVLLAEANVPYSQLYDMDDINSEFERTDVALVIGANDVVNPDAKEDPNSPIYGMPILEVDKAKNTIVIKRSMKPGYAGIDNQLFYREKTMMYFGSAKEAVADLVSEIKQL